MIINVIFIIKAIFLNNSYLIKKQQFKTSV